MVGEFDREMSMWRQKAREYYNNQNRCAWILWKFKPMPLKVIIFWFLYDFILSDIFWLFDYFHKKSSLKSKIDLIQFNFLSFDSSLYSKTKKKIYDFKVIILLFWCDFNDTEWNLLFFDYFHKKIIILHLNRIQFNFM